MNHIINLKRDLTNHKWSHKWGRLPEACYWI